MRKLFGWLICSSFLFSCNTDSKTAASKEETSSAAGESKEYEFADQKFIEIGKKGLAYLKSGDIDGWMTGFADNAVYRWNNFDSLSGKAAISDYWKKRTADVIDSISFSSDIWLPVKVNIPQTEGQLTGNYVLGWYVLDATYKTGKSIKQRSHVVIHFDANDKIDRLSQYIDRAPINAALAK